MLPKIALEEHFMAPGFEPYWATTVDNVAPAGREAILRKLNDFGEERLSGMDGAGIAHAVLSIAGPGVQREPDAATARKLSVQGNDFLAEQIAKNPKRYSGFAHLPMQDAKAAADELQRCVEQLGFRGAMINGHTNGQYLDHPDLYPFWERAEALGVPVYIHPADPMALFPALEGQPGLRRATWEWTLETGSHALRLVFSGLFDRFPKATVALGHLGETLPYLLWRFDSRAKLYGIKLDREPSDYIKSNLVVTLSGMFSREPLICALEALGHDRVMFSADYPFEGAKEGAEFMDSVAIDEELRKAICYGNAERLLKMKL
jgi:2,3-dihydroxybenzoate decarboxylase